MVLMLSHLQLPSSSEFGKHRCGRVKNTQICQIDSRLLALLFAIEILISTRVLDSRLVGVQADKF